MKSFEGSFHFSGRETPQKLQPSPLAPLQVLYRSKHKKSLLKLGFWGVFLRLLGPPCPLCLRAPTAMAEEEEEGEEEEREEEEGPGCQARSGTSWRTTRDIYLVNA